MSTVVGYGSRSLQDRVQASFRRTACCAPHYRQLADANLDSTTPCIRTPHFITSHLQRPPVCDVKLPLASYGLVDDHSDLKLVIAVIESVDARVTKMQRSLYPGSFPLITCNLTDRDIGVTVQLPGTVCATESAKAPSSSFRRPHEPLDPVTSFACPSCMCRKQVSRGIQICSVREGTMRGAFGARYSSKEMGGWRLFGKSWRRGKPAEDTWWWTRLMYAGSRSSRIH